ncbi:MAG TPA: hypothetical protein DD638_03620, partial [Pasteurellaceae bacterium]|nr:hypothetical protein [Pasteurellaceae bacterium]
VEHVEIDYACLTDLPSDSSGEKTSLNLTALLGFLPDGEMDIQTVRVINTEQVTKPALHQLMKSKAHINLIKHNDQLRFSVEMQQESGVVFRLNSTLNNFLLAGSAYYQPSEEQSHRLDFELNLNEELTQLPHQGKLDLHWEQPDLTLPKGLFSLQWKERQGHAELQDLIHQVTILNLPFKFESDQIQIEKGNFYWEIGEQQPLQGVLNLTLSKITEEWLPLKTNMRISLLSEGAQGKGNLVIYGENGEIGKERIEVPLEAHGNFKYDNSIAYTDVVFNLAGYYDDLFIHFRPISTVRVTGRGEDFSLNVHLPLDGVLIGRYGVEGRLQAILQGSTPQFSDLDLRLDGQAREFIAGIKSIFDIRDGQNRMRRTEGMAANLWEWNLTGKGTSKALKTLINVQGKGFWLDNHVEIQQLEGYSGAIHTAGIKIPKVELKLADNLRWYYEEDKIFGLVQVKAPFIDLDYGGRFVSPVFGLGLEGKDITDFNLAGDLKAGDLGPIKVFAHYRDRELIGNIYWLEQSAKVFQPLFPGKWDWIIQKGTIRGQTAFDVTAEKGIRAGGHFAVRAGEISLPDGEINGIEFALPYRYSGGLVELTKSPVEVFVKQIKSGALEIENLRVKVQG